MSPVYPGVPQNLHPNAMDIRQQQPAVYFDYNAASRPPSQYFYSPPQPMMYPPHSPMLSSQLPAPSAPVTLAEKKLEMQVRVSLSFCVHRNLIPCSKYNLQQQLASRNLMFRAAASPHPQAYNAGGLDYGSQMLNAATMYGTNVSSTPTFSPSMRGRRHDMQQELALPRSPMLDEFRASNKGRKWELRVNRNVFDLCFQNLNTFVGRT
jgi:hypothetical protein